MSVERKPVLLPVDGSDQSMEVVRYVSRAVDLSRTEVVLLSIIDRAPDIFWDTGQDPKVNEHLEHMKTWDSYREQRMRECMEESCNILEQAGVPRAAMTCNIRKRNEGIARDIICECRCGYSAVAIGRNGLGQMNESMLGSIAAKVFINVADAPVCLLGGKPKPGKIMIGLDSSLSAIRAVEFVGRMLNSEGVGVTLTHIIRTPENRIGKPLRASDPGRVVDEREAEMGPVFEKAIMSLSAAGFAPDKIETMMIEGGGSRAVHLYNEAASGRYGAVVVGRKGVSDVQEFTMGKMPYKLGQIARNVALWLVP
ncbi:MAG: universal stress protein [Syntrophobacteraceae bacterium]